MPPTCRILLLAACWLHAAAAQCMYIPLPKPAIDAEAALIATGHVTAARTYEAEDGNLYTRFVLAVEAWEKGRPAPAPDTLHVIGMGGTLPHAAQHTYPAVHMRPGARYRVCLLHPATTGHDPALRRAQPHAYQAMPAADFQGVRILPAQAPGGTQATISSFSPATTRGGTILPADFLTIHGSGFGSSPGTVTFANADDAGATTLSPAIASDYVSWADNKVVVKVPSNAGTGLIGVNGASSSGPLTVQYGHNCVESDFSGFAAPTRQRYYFRNKNGAGGYTLLFHTSIAALPLAQAAFLRGIETWRCNSGIHWTPGGTTTSGFANDGACVALFDASLPSGILGRTTSRYKANANTACNQANTLWWLDEFDVQMKPNPLSNNRTWEFGPALPTSSEFDFESVVLHELGHAHGLAHRIAPGEAMHYAIFNGATARQPNALELAAADARLAYSTASTCLNPSGAGTPHVLYPPSLCLTTAGELPAPAPPCAESCLPTGPRTWTWAGSQPVALTILSLHAQPVARLALQPGQAFDLHALPPGLYMAAFSAPGAHCAARWLLP